MNIPREKLFQDLPISGQSLLIRRCERSDLDLLAAWPPYPEPYDVFTFSFVHLGPSQLDSFYRDREREDRRMTLVADFSACRSVGYLALLEIDWDSRESQNLGIRVHPEFCGRGIGRLMLEGVRDWWFANGMKALRLDVASSNSRAVKCYEKAGFVKSGESWREAPDLRSANLADQKWRFLDGHVRFTSGAPELRFLIMELRPG